ncbi:gag-pol polyprotein [Tanacetum coccineum]
MVRLAIRGKEEKGVYPTSVGEGVMAKELVTPHHNHTLDLVPLLVSKRVIGFCWVHKIKTIYDGSIGGYKVHLVSKGYSQELGMRYEETFSPSAKLTIVLTLITLAFSCQ